MNKIYKKTYIKNFYDESKLEKKDKYIMQILKSVYRYKYNNGLNNINISHYNNILNKINTKLTINDANVLLSKISAVSIPKPSNNLEGFHNFDKIEYYIYNSKLKLSEKYDSEEYAKLCPFYFSNGLFSINSQFKTYFNKHNSDLEDYIKNKDNIEQLLKNINNKTSNNGKKLNFIKKNISVNKADKLIDLNKMINTIDIDKCGKYLGYIFQKEIINLRNNNNYINIENFNLFCKELNNTVDSIVIFIDGKNIYNYTYDIKNIIKFGKKSILYPDNLKKYISNNNLNTNTNANTNANLQYGGDGEAEAFCLFLRIFPASLGIFIWFAGTFIGAVAGFLFSLYECLGWRKNIFKTILGYVPCVIWNTFFITIFSSALAFDFALPIIFMEAVSSGAPNSIIYMFFWNNNSSSSGSPNNVFFNKIFKSLAIGRIENINTNKINKKNSPYAKYYQNLKDKEEVKEKEKENAKHKKEEEIKKIWNTHTNFNRL
jgi:hypothetical protein